MKYLLEFEMTRESGPHVGIHELAEAIESEITEVWTRHPGNNAESQYSVTNVRPYFPPKEFSARAGSFPVPKETS